LFNRGVGVLIGVAWAASLVGIDDGWFTVIAAFQAIVFVLTVRPLIQNLAAGLLPQSRPSFGVGDDVDTNGCQETVETDDAVEAGRGRPPKGRPQAGFLDSVEKVLTAGSRLRAAMPGSVTKVMTQIRTRDVPFDRAESDGFHETDLSSTVRVLCRGSATDGGEPPILWRRQAPKIVLDRATGCDPCDALGDVAAGWLRSEKLGSLVGYLMLGAVAQGAVDDRVPSYATVGFGGSLSEGVGNPFGWLVGDGGESVAMSVVGFAVQVQVVDETLRFAAVIL
jgi:hypothetical protein